MLGCSVGLKAPSTWFLPHIAQNMEVRAYHSLQCFVQLYLLREGIWQGAAVVFNGPSLSIEGVIRFRGVRRCTSPRCDIGMLTPSRVLDQ